MEINERVSKLETKIDLHMESFKTISASNKEHHKTVFNKLDNMNVQLSKIELLLLFKNVVGKHGKDFFQSH